LDTLATKRRQEQREIEDQKSVIYDLDGEEVPSAQVAMQDARMQMI